MATIKPGKYRVIGTSPLRYDGVDKVTGKALFGDDVRLPGTLVGKILAALMLTLKSNQSTLMKPLRFQVSEPQLHTYISLPFQKDTAAYRILRDFRDIAPISAVQSLNQ